MEELEEDKQHQDLSFLSGETGLGKDVFARFVLAYKLAQPRLQPEFWFALLGGSFFDYTGDQSLKNQLAGILSALPSLDAAAARKALTCSFNAKEIPEALQKVAGWVGTFLKFVASLSVSGAARPTFVKSALEHAGIKNNKKQETFAGLFNKYKALTPSVLKALERDKSFKSRKLLICAHLFS